jgi:hypothetical protein
MTARRVWNTLSTWHKAHHGSEDQEEEEWHILLNLVLVFANARCASLVESANVREGDFYKELKTVINRLTQQFPHVGSQESTTAAPRLLVFNTSCVPKTKVERTLEHDADLGTALEFLCPGEMDQSVTRYGISIVFNSRHVRNGEDVELRAEICPKSTFDAQAEVMESKIARRVERYTQVLKSVFDDAVIRAVKTTRWTMQDLVVAVDKPLTEDVRDQVRNELYNSDFKHSIELLNQRDPTTDAKYRKLWQMMLVYGKFDPEAQFYPLSPEQTVRHTSNMHDLENAWYRIYDT